MAKVELQFGELGGSKTYRQTKTFTIVNNQFVVDDVGFQPTLVVVMTPNYIYTYNPDVSNDTFVCPNQAWGSGYGGYFNSITPTASGFTIKPATSSESGVTATIFCA